MRYTLTLTLVVLAFLAGMVTGRHYPPTPVPEASVTGRSTPGHPLPGTPGTSGSKSSWPEATSPLPYLVPDMAVDLDTATPPPSWQLHYPEIPAVEDLAGQKELQAELFVTLRESGLPEEEIKAQVQALHPPQPSLEEQFSPYELSAAEKSPEELRKELEAALRESGLPPEEVEYHLEAFMKQFQQPERPPLPAPPPSAE